MSEPTITQLLREDLRDQSAYGAPQLDVPVQLNTNENPYGPSDACADDIAAAVRAAATTLTRLLPKGPGRCGRAAARADS